MNPNTTISFLALIGKANNNKGTFYLVVSFYFHTKGRIIFLFKED